MNTYYSMLGRLLHGKTPIHKKGYYILCQDNCIRFNLERPLNVMVIDAEQFVDTLVNGCKEVIDSFSKSPDNQEVYALSLYVNDYKTIYVYINNVAQSERTMQARYANHEDRNIDSLEYNLAEFKFQFWSQHMGAFGQLLDDFEQFADSPSYDRDEEALQAGDQPIIAFEAGIIDTGYHALILEAMIKLKTENAFDSLNRTQNFIAFASTTNDYIDCSILMRKTIESNLLYEVFPDLKEKDIQFQAWVNQNRSLSASNVLDQFHDIFLNNYYLDIPYSMNRCEYDVFEQLEHLGNALAMECLNRLHQFTTIKSLEREHFDLIHCYIEALHFAGKLTSEQKNTCSQLAHTFLEQNEDLIDAARELNALAAS